MGAKQSKTSIERASVEPHILKMEACQNLDCLWDLFCDVAASYGADLVSYHHIPPSIALDHISVNVLRKGYDPNWINMYHEQKLFWIDPVIQTARHTLIPFFWKSIESRARLTEDQKKFMITLRQWVKGDGLAIPTYGPSARNGYFGVGCREHVPNWSRQDIVRLHWAAQAFHIRYSVIHMVGLNQDFTLTSRETQILQHLSRGLDMRTIAALLGTQADTVDNTIRRIMRKMNVTDTASAILRGISCGLIEPI